MPMTMPGIISPVYTEEESFEDGRLTGLRWTDSYRPGGPWVPNPGHTQCEEVLAWVAQMRTNNRAWLRGFDEGLAQRS